MKSKFFGGFIMLVGLVILAVGINTIAVAAGDEDMSGAKPEVTIKTGVYVLDDDFIEIFDDHTFSMNGGEAQPFQLKIWYDMPVTDEATGKITLTDYYFLGTNLDGGDTFSEKIAYDYQTETLTYDNQIFVLAS